LANIKEEKEQKSHSLKKQISGKKDKSESGRTSTQHSKENSK
jgi:hypothetical protein